MNFGIIYQLKIKKFWWLDTIFYFVVALLLATLICFAIFTIKISSQKERLKELEDNMARTGTIEQKKAEEEVFKYQRKIDDFVFLLAGHKIPTKVLKLFEEITLSNVWFNSFSAITQTTETRVAGEAESTIALSRQLSILEKNEFITDITDLSSEITETGKIRFSMNVSFVPDMFFLNSADDLMQPSDILETTSPSTSLFFNENIF